MKNEQQLARETLLSIYSDVWKDLHGVRPRGSLFPSELSYEEIEAKLSKLEAELHAKIEEERYQEDAATRDTE
jgi:protein-arginine kinase activator protein McsA